MALLHTSGGATCPICGDQECTGIPTVPHLASYPFLAGGIDPMADQQYVIAPHAIEDPDLERHVYGAGDRVPIADAVKYGLIPDPDAKPAGRAKKGPTEDRAKRPAGNRAKRGPTG